MNQPWIYMYSPSWSPLPKRHRCIEQTVGLLWEKARVGCFKRTASKHVYYLGWNRSPAQVGCMTQVLGPGALGRPRKTSILYCSALFIVQLSHPYMTTGKTIALTRWTFVGKLMSLLFNILSRLVIVFLPRSKCFFLISWLQSPPAVILEPPPPPK